MKKRERSIQGIVVGVVILLLVGCAGKGVKNEEPEWVQKGSGAFLDNDQKVFYGVGAITGVKNKPMAKTAAEPGRIRPA